MSERYVAHCRSCSFQEDYGMQTLAREAADQHRALSGIVPGRPRHEVEVRPANVRVEQHAAPRASTGAAETASVVPVANMAKPSRFDPWMRFYNRLGLRVTPLHAACAACRRDPTHAVRCKACAGGKKPVLLEWQDGGELAEEGNMGIVCGAPSRHLTVLDFDEPGMLERVFRMGASDLAERTLVCATQRGHHVYLRLSGVGCPKPRICATCWRHEKAHPWDLCEKPSLVVTFDVKGEGGQVVAPPSHHLSGHQYHYLPGRALSEGLITDAELLLRPGLIEILRTATSQAKLNNNSNTGNTNTAAAPPGVPVLSGELRAALQALAEAQAPAFLVHWRILLGEASPLPSELGGRSKSDYVFSLCLAERGCSAEQIQLTLMSLPGSKARDPQHGAPYALLTAREAIAEKRLQRSGLGSQGRRATG